MKNAIAIVSLLVVSCVLGCSASASVGSKSPVDWRRAYVSGPEVPVAYCDKNKAGDEAAYYACLEELQRQRQAYNIGAPPPAPPPTTSATPPPAPPPPATASAAPPALLPPPPPPATTGPELIYIPGAVGPRCETNQELMLEIENSSNYLVEVRAGTALAPLGCDAQNKLVRVNVIRNNSQLDLVWAIPPNTPRSVYVFNPLNGGLGRVEVFFTAYMSLPCQNGVCPPNPAVAHMERSFNVPQKNSRPNAQIVSPAYLRNYGQRY